MSTNLASLLNTALNVVTRAESHLRAHPPERVHAKGERDLVTDMDLAIERLVRSLLADATPDIGFLGEEEGLHGNRDHYWVLDPIDGTVNYTHGLPLCGISLALVLDQRPVVGVIALPWLGHRYWAARNLGAWRDGSPITTSRTEQLDTAIVAVGDYTTGPGSEAQNRAYAAVHAYLAPRAQRIRMLGSAAIDLAWVADGTLDASITLSNRSWDMAAGAVIAQEAGALVCDADGKPHTTTSATTIACAPALGPEILRALKAPAC